MSGQPKTSKEVPDNMRSGRFLNPIKGGAIGFGIGFVFVGLIATLIMLIEPQIKFTGIFLISLHSAIAISLQSAVGGGIGGMLLAWNLPSRRRFSVAIAGALGVGLGELLTIYVSSMIGKQFSADYSLAIRSILMGVLVGMLIAMIEKRWKYIVHFAVLSMIGFTTYHLFIYWLYSLIPFAAFGDNKTIPTLIMIAANGIGGMMVGACLGVSLAKSMDSDAGNMELRLSQE